jgi:uncharacterized protein YndB with AHSA1/START domain
MNFQEKLMRFLVLGLAMLTMAAVAPVARADVVSASPSAFVIHAQRTVSAPPDRVWNGLVQVGRWWNPEHSYSRDARSLSLDPRAGGCWCERWRGGSVEHGRVILVMNQEGVRTLRISAPLGPLQAMAVNAILTFTVTPDTAGAKIDMTYRVSGDPSLSLDQVGPGVNVVIMEQYERLIRFVTSGSPR